jgi:phosphoribosylcarboxyaminoimidazole (NCAIR) mutase
MDSLLATVQMPAGIPVATVAIGKPGATNAGILAAQMIALGDASDGEEAGRTQGKAGARSGREVEET